MPIDTYSLMGDPARPRLRRFERVRDKFNNDAPPSPEPVEGHVPDQATEKIIGSPGGATCRW